MDDRQERKRESNQPANNKIHKSTNSHNQSNHLSILLSLEAVRPKEVGPLLCVGGALFFGVSPSIFSSKTILVPETNRDHSTIWTRCHQVLVKTHRDPFLCPASFEFPSNPLILLIHLPQALGWPMFQELQDMCLCSGPGFLDWDRFQWWPGK